MPRGGTLIRPACRHGVGRDSPAGAVSEDVLDFQAREEFQAADHHVGSWSRTSASSKARDCALVRLNTAMSRSLRPPRRSRLSSRRRSAPPRDRRPAFRVTGSPAGLSSTGSSLARGCGPPPRRQLPGMVLVDGSSGRAMSGGREKNHRKSDSEGGCPPRRRASGRSTGRRREHAQVRCTPTQQRRIRRYSDLVVCPGTVDQDVVESGPCHTGGNRRIGSPAGARPQQQVAENSRVWRF